MRNPDLLWVLFLVRPDGSEEWIHPYTTRDKARQEALWWLSEDKGGNRFQVRKFVRVPQHKK